MRQIVKTYFDLVKRQMPVVKERGAIGIDAGQLSVRIVELSRSKGFFCLERVLVVPQDGWDEKSSLAKVMAGLDLAKQPRPVVVSVSGKGTLLRFIDFPRMPLHELKKAFLMQVEKYFPFPKDTILSDCVILDPDGTDKKMSVMAVAVKKDLFEARSKSFKGAGVEASAVSLSPAALANAFAAFPPSAAEAGQEKKITVLVDIADQGTSLLGMVEGMPKFFRDVPIGVAEIVKRIVNSSGVAASEVRDMLSSAERPEPVAKAFEAVMASLAAEIKMSFEYFMTEKNIPVGRIYIVGEGARTVGLEKALAASMTIPLSAWNPLEKIERAPQVDGELVGREGVALAAALGLALQEYD
jgi:type IV pilus assembly protein PilM